ncbi:unnamed protein product [Jaminaea pallidilutea]
MASFPPEQLRWLVRNMDAAGTAEKRATHQAVHSERFAKYKAAHPGVLEYGGPIIDPESGKSIGSCLQILFCPDFDTIEKVKAFLDEDPFVKNAIYDPAQRSVNLYVARHIPLAMQKSS